MVSDPSVHHLTNIVRWLEDLSLGSYQQNPHLSRNPGNSQAGEKKKESVGQEGGGKNAKEGEEERVAKRKIRCVCVCVVNCSQGPNQLRYSQIEMDGLTIDGWMDESR